MSRPAPNSIITLRERVLDSNGDLLPVGLDVVVLDAYDDGSILVAAENEAQASDGLRFGRTMKSVMSSCAKGAKSNGSPTPQSRS